jgi:hypothetical protein
MATQYGTAVNFGFPTTANGITITGVSGTLLQSADHTKQADVFEVRDADGDIVNRTFYNQSDEATLEYIVTGTGLADAITNTALQTPGSLLVITACANMPSLVATTWQVEPGHKLSGSNMDAKKITVPLKKHAGVTATASA